MAFWSEHISQPKRQYRWVMNIGGIPQWIVKKVNKPGFTVSEASHKYLNHTFYYPGRIEYEKTSVTLVDPLVPDASAMMLNILYHSGYSIPDSPDDTVTMSKRASVEALGRVAIAQLDADGAIADEWIFRNPWISSIKFGDLDYEGDNLIDLTLELRYDFVEMNVAESGGVSWGSFTPASGPGEGGRPDTPQRGANPLVPAR